MQSYRAGYTSLDVIKVGDFKLVLSHLLKVPEKDWRPKYGDLFERGILSPGNCILIRAPGASILVDPNDFALSSSPDSEYYPSPGYKPPPDLVTQLRTISVKPEDITHVVITHAHFDHYAGVTRKTSSGKFEPTYPRARYYLGAADWESQMIREDLEKENSEARNTLQVLHDLKMLELVKGAKILPGSVNIIPSPGESPGHQLLEVTSGDRSFYCVGDLFHHWVEVEEPDWGPDWADAKLNTVSKKMLSEAAASTNAIVIPGHMAPGRIRKKDGSFHWEEEK
jgi:glyoxylase-like metal-dependent hydrolase (beta-lactamase superfamily II)